MSLEMEERILKELHDMRKDIIEVKIVIKEIGYDLQHVRPEYIKKLEKIDKGKFFSRRDFEKVLCE